MTARTVFTGLLVLVALWVAREFLTAIAWAAVIAVTVWPVYSRFSEGISEKRSAVVAPLLFTILTGAVLLLPITVAAHQLAKESETILRAIGELRDNGIPVPAWVAQLPLAGEQLQQWWRMTLADPQTVGQWLSSLNTEGINAWARALGGELFRRVVLFFVALFALFFLLRDGAWIGRRALDTADRILGDPGERLASKMVDAIRGTVNGTVLVALAEGLIIGSVYVVAGVPNAFLLALLTAAFAMLPFGAWIVFSVASLLLVIQGSALAAAGVFGFGALVMIIGDNFIWPALVGGAARLPFLLAFVGIFGGLQTFGLLGLFLGPVIMAALLTVWREWLRPQEG